MNISTIEITTKDNGIMRCKEHGMLVLICYVLYKLDNIFSKNIFVSTIVIQN